jgi:hypothetical protein
LTAFVTVSADSVGSTVAITDTMVSIGSPPSSGGQDLQRGPP